MIIVNIPQMISICLLCFGTGVLAATIIQSVIIRRNEQDV